MLISRILDMCCKMHPHRGVYVYPKRGVIFITDHHTVVEINGFPKARNAKDYWIRSVDMSPANELMLQAGDLTKIPFKQKSPPSYTLDYFKDFMAPVPLAEGYENDFALYHWGACYLFQQYLPKYYFGSYYLCEGKRLKWVSELANVKLVTLPYALDNRRKKDTGFWVPKDSEDGDSEDKPPESEDEGQAG